LNLIPRCLMNTERRACKEGNHEDTNHARGRPLYTWKAMEDGRGAPFAKAIRKHNSRLPLTVNWMLIDSSLRQALRVIICTCGDIINPFLPCKYLHSRVQNTKAPNKCSIQAEHLPSFGYINHKLS